MAQSMLAQAATMANNIWISELIGAVSGAFTGGVGYEGGGGGGRTNTITDTSGYDPGRTYDGIGAAKGLTATSRKSGAFKQQLQTISQGGLY